MRTLLAAVFFFCMSQVVYSANNESLDYIVEDILREVVDQAIEDGKRIVQENTGIDLSKRGYEGGYGYGREGEWDREDRDKGERRGKDREKGKGWEKGKDQQKIIRELNQLSKEHDREIIKLEGELHRELSHARNEFARESAQEDKREKIAKKRLKLKNKVDKSYAKFHQKIREKNRRFDEKRMRLLDRIDI